MFYAAISEALAEKGWVRMPGPSGTSALFAKRSENLVLSLAFFESDLHEDRITAELALAGHTSLLMMGFPGLAHSRCRVGEYLTQGERARLLDDRYNRPGVVDAWWAGRNSDTVAAMVEAIETAAPRFLSRPGLREDIAASQRHQAYVAKLRAIAAVPLASASRKVPPTEWVEAAYALLAETPPKHRRAAAARQAADAWRTYRVLGLPLEEG